MKINTDTEGPQPKRTTSPKYYKKDAPLLHTQEKKQDRQGEGRTPKIQKHDAHPHLCPVRICRAYLAYLTDASPHDRLLRNPNVTKTKLSRQPMGKNGPLRYLRWAASFAGIDEEALHRYGTNSWRKVGANKLAQQAGARVMQIVREGTSHKSDTATKAYLSGDSLTAIATASAQILADASRATPNEPVSTSSTSTSLPKSLHAEQPPPSVQLPQHRQSYPSFRRED
jgi:hypothetical protein